MKPNKITLKNGLRLLVTPMPTLESATLTVWVNVGSRYEETKIGGISHFLEHMVFKGSVKRPSAREISEAIDAIGGEFNAGTSKEWTNFYIKARKGSLETSFDVLSDMVLNPILKDEEIEKEKGVIIEEMAMYEDTPMYRVGEVFEQLMFEGTQLAPDIIGTKESVKNITRDDFVRYRSMHYFTDNIVLTVAGGVDLQNVIELAEKYFGEIKSGEKTKIEIALNNQTEPKLKLVTKKNEQAHLVLGFTGNKRGTKDRFAEELLATILGGGMSSRVWSEVREKRGLAYSVQTDVDHYLDTGYISTYAGVEVGKIDDAIKVIIDEYNALKDGTKPIEQKELSKAKEYLKGHIALSLEDTKKVNRFFGEDELLLGVIEDVHETFKALDEVTVSDIVEVANKFFKKDRMSLAIIGPYDDQERFAKLIK